MPVRSSGLARGSFWALLTIATWTAFIVGSRALSTRSLAPPDVVFIRFAVGAALLAPWGWWVVRRRGGGWLRISPLSARHTIGLGMVGGVIFGLLAYHGFALAPASHSAVLMPGMLPLWTALFAWLINGERIGSRRLLGLVLILAGALTVGWLALRSVLDGGTVWMGDLLYLFAPLTWAIYTNLCRRWRAGAAEATTAVAIFATLAFGLPYLVIALAGWVPSGLARAPWSEIVTQGVLQGFFGVVVSGIAFMKTVEAFGAIRATMLTATVPGIAAATAVLFLGEPFTWTLVVGLGCVSLGIVIGVTGGPPARRA